MKTSSSPWRRKVAFLVLALTMAFLLGRYLTQAPQPVELTVCLPQAERAQTRSLTLALLRGDDLVRRATFPYRGAMPECQVWPLSIAKGDYGLRVEARTAGEPLVWERSLEVLGEGAMELTLPARGL